MHTVTMTTATKPVVISAYFIFRMSLCICYMRDVYIVFLYAYVHFLQFIEVWK